MSRPFSHGSIPPGWTSTKLRTVMTRKKRLGRPDLPLLSVNLPVGVLVRPTDSGRQAPSEDLSGYQVVNEGDLVVNQLGKPHGALGVSKHSGIISPAYFVAEFAEKVEPHFMHHLLRTRLYISEYERRGKFMPPNQFDISWDEFRDIEIVLPPRSQQKMIADYLDIETARIDALIEKKQRQIKLIEERFNADGLNIISGVSSDFENSSDKSGSVNRSSEWLPLKLAWCLKTGSGTTPTSGTANYYSEDGIPWVTTAELREDVILKTSMGVTDEARRNFSALKIFPTGTVLVAMYGATVGRAAVLGIEACVNQACCAIFGQGRIKIDFFYWWARLHRQDLIDLGYGSGQPNISQDTIRSLRIDTPSLEQQEAIVHYLANSWARTEALLNMTKQHIQLLVERKQSMITAAVTGELEIPGVAA